MVGDEYLWHPESNSCGVVVAVRRRYGGWTLPTYPAGCFLHTALDGSHGPSGCANDGVTSRIVPKLYCGWR